MRAIKVHITRVAGEARFCLNIDNGDLLAVDFEVEAHRRCSAKKSF